MASYSNNRHTVRDQRDLDQINCCGLFLRQKFGYRVTGVEVIHASLMKIWQQPIQSILNTVGPLTGCGEKVKFCGIFRDKFIEKLADFAEMLGANFAE